MNPLAITAAPVQGGVSEFTAPCAFDPIYTFLSYNFFNTFLSFSGEGRRPQLQKASSFLPRFDAGRLLTQGRNPTHRGGTLVVIFDPTTGIIRLVNQAYLWFFPTVEISTVVPIFSVMRRPNLSEHHS